MKQYRYVKSNAFTSGSIPEQRSPTHSLSLGNPAACIFTGQEELAPEQMQAIAAEHKGFVMEVVFCSQSEVADCKLTYYSSECAYPAYPPKPEDMVAQYAADNIFPFTAISDDGNVVGHIMLRYSDPSKTIIRFGFVIVDDNLRGKGYGKEMLQLAIQKAKEEFEAKKITLGVFDNNPSAFHCYESVGFKVIGTDSYLIDGVKWTEKEMAFPEIWL